MTYRMKLYIWSFLTFNLLIITPLHAASDPVITRLDATMLQDKVFISFSWKSDSPVVEIRASGGKNMKVINKDTKNGTKEKIDNDRSPQGYYTGKMAIELDSTFVSVAKVYASKKYNSQLVKQGNSLQKNTSYEESTEPSQQVIVVTVQVVDKYGIESDKRERVLPTVLEFAAHPEPSQSASNVSTQTQNTNPPSISNVSANLVGAIVDAGRGLLTTVVVRESKILPDGRLTVIAEASSVNEIQQLTFNVLNQHNTIVTTGTLIVESISGRSNAWKGETNTPLAPGRYAVSIIGEDSKGNKINSQPQWINVPKAVSTSVSATPQAAVSNNQSPPVSSEQPSVPSTPPGTASPNTL